MGVLDEALLGRPLGATPRPFSTNIGITCDGFSPSTAEPGESVTVSYTCGNSTTDDRCFTVEVLLDGNVEASDSHCLQGGETSSFSQSFSAPSSTGDYTLSVQTTGETLLTPDGQLAGNVQSIEPFHSDTCGTLTVEEPFSSSDVFIVDGSGVIDPNPVAEDETVSFFVDVTNNNSQDASVDLAFYDANGTVWASSSFTIFAGDTTTLGLSEVPQDIGISPGDYDMTGEISNIQQALLGGEFVISDVAPAAP